jgi:hypothetical protein
MTRKGATPRTAIESCHCERSEAISHCCTEIATHPTGARNDGKNRVVAKSIAVLGCNHRTSQQGAGDATLLLVTFLMGVCECPNLF